jgi:1,4-dihydroxy-2-naphthoate octaprenyltransferase
MVKVRPKDWAAAKAGLILGTAVAAPYEAKMTADNFVGCA